MNLELSPSLVACRPDTPSANVFGLWRVEIDQRLERISQTLRASPLHAAMHYSLMSPGKRLRPLLTLAVAHHFGQPVERALDCAAAIEMVHAASLIIDDLPCMDDDDLRRGQPTTHRTFGEDTALLAAIALLTHGYQIIATMPDASDTVRLKLVTLLTSTVGPMGLSQGQHDDLKLKHVDCTAPVLSHMHHLKTGVLFIAAAEAGACMGQASADQHRVVRDFACALGLAFQALDDLDDVQKNESNLAHTVGAQQAHGVLHTHVRRARELADSLVPHAQTVSGSTLRSLLDLCFPNVA